MSKKRKCRMISAELRASGFAFEGQAGGLAWSGERHGNYYISSAEMKNRWAKETLQMERLTDRKEADSQRKVYERHLAQGFSRNIPEERFLRLAAYEDTGCMPEDILNGKELAEMACAMKLLQRYQALGTVEELAAWKESTEQIKKREI